MTLKSDAKFEEKMTFGLENDMKNTVKPRHSGHQRDREKVSAIERCPLHRGSSQIYLFFINNTNFTLKTCFGGFRVLYSGDHSIIKRSFLGRERDLR